MCRICKELVPKNNTLNIPRLVSTFCLLMSQCFFGHNIQHDSSWMPVIPIRILKQPFIQSYKTHSLMNKCWLYGSSHLAWVQFLTWVVQNVIYIVVQWKRQTDLIKLTDRRFPLAWTAEQVQSDPLDHQLWQTTEESQRVQWLKHSNFNNQNKNTNSTISMDKPISKVQSKMIH